MNRPIMVPAGDGRWRVVCDWHYFGFTVPAGFVCDLDSVPRLPVVFWLAKNRTVIAAVLHDYLYRHQPVTRRAADILFLLAMEYEGVPTRFQVIIYAGVRLGGWIGWKRNRRKINA